MGVRTGGSMLALDIIEDTVVSAPFSGDGRDARCEPRHEDIVESAVIFFRGQKITVPVVNISSRGTMVECDILPRIGEAIVIQFEHCTRIHAFVRWVREGRLGLNFGHEIILG